MQFKNFYRTGSNQNQMQVEIGKIYEGTVKNITNYGTFVDIHNPENEKIMEWYIFLRFQKLMSMK